MASLVEHSVKTPLLVLLLFRVAKFIVQSNYEGSSDPKNPYEQTAQFRTPTPQTPLSTSPWFQVITSLCLVPH